MSAVFSNGITVKGAAVFTGTANLPASSVTNEKIAAGAGISASKVVHRFPLFHAQADGTAVADEVIGIHVAGAAGEVKSVEVGVTGSAATGDSTVDVDVKKSTGGGAFATVLSSAITIDNGNTVRTVESGTVSGGTYADGDLLQIDINATVGTGSLPQGMVVTVICEENPA